MNDVTGKKNIMPNATSLKEVNDGLARQVQVLVQRKQMESALNSSPEIDNYPLQKRLKAITSAICEIVEGLSPEDIVLKTVRPDLREKGMGDYTIDIPKLKANRPGEESGTAITRFRTEILPRLVEELPEKLPFHVDLKQVGIFLNVTLDNNDLLNDTLTTVETMGDEFGDSDIFKGESYVLDFSSPNMGKPMHVGHLRTTVIGQVISNLLHKTGATVYAVNHVGDWGTIFGHLMTAYEKWGEEIAKEINPDEDPMGFLSALYVKVRKEIKRETEKNGSSETEEIGRRNFSLLEASDPKAVAIWQKINQWSMVELERVYKRLGISFDIFLGESFYTAGMSEMVEATKKTGLAELGLDGQSLVIEFGEKPDADPEGPSLTEIKAELRVLYDRIQVLKEDEVGNAEEIKRLDALMRELDQKANKRRVLPLCMVQKADGASVYLTRDITAIRERKRDFKADRIIYVIGAEQKLHMQQIYKVAERLGDINEGDCTHVSFGLINKPDGTKISSREGAGGLMGLLDELRDEARKLVDTPEKRAYIPEDQMTEIAERIAKGALIYANFAQDREHDMVFNPDDMLSINNQTGPYLQYSVVRISSLLEKLGEDSGEEIDPKIFENVDSRAIDVVERIGRFPEVIATCASKNAPHLLATYLYELSTAFNKFYTGSVSSIGRITDLKGTDKIVYKKIIAATNAVLRKGLAVLNIEVPSRM